VTTYFDGSPRNIQAASVPDASDMAGFWSEKARERSDAARAARGGFSPFAAAAQVKPRVGKAAAAFQNEAGLAPKAVPAAAEAAAARPERPVAAAAMWRRAGGYRSTGSGSGYMQRAFPNAVSGPRSGSLQRGVVAPRAPAVPRPAGAAPARPAAAAALLAKGQPPKGKKAAPWPVAMTAAQLLAEGAAKPAAAGAKAKAVV
jgi:hypothetical protein